MMDTELVAIKAQLLEAQKSAQSTLAIIEFALARIDALQTNLIVTTLGQSPVPKPEPIKVAEPELIMNEEWLSARSAMETGNVVFITGEAGTGKSTLTRQFIGDFKGNLARLAPTGRAALNIGGETIHRFFGFPGHALAADDIPVLHDTRREEKYKNLDAILIDEASMIRADLMDAIDIFMRQNGRHKNKPFGGVRLILVGDLFQLPPVSKDAGEKKWLIDLYGVESPYFFHANCFRDNPITICNLTTIYRQKDREFTGALNAIRQGCASGEQIGLINRQVKPNFKVPKGEQWITMTTTNDSAAKANQIMINQLPGSSSFFQATVSGEFDLNNAPTDEVLELKVGAAVMFVKNDALGQWKNGTLGTITSIDESFREVTVDINGNEVDVSTEKWAQIVHTFDPASKKLTHKETGSFTQLPLRLGAAITIHKSQGQTFERCILDLGFGAFAAGQAYVGLSRCTSLEGMILKRPVKPKDLITSTEVQRFMRGEPITRAVSPQGSLF